MLHMQTTPRADGWTGPEAVRRGLADSLRGIRRTGRRRHPGSFLQIYTGLHAGG